MERQGQNGVEKSNRGWVWKRRVREGIWGKTNNTKGHLKNYMETYCRNFLKYILIYKRNLNGVTNLWEEIMPSTRHLMP